jgi:BNR repeat-like domain
LATHLAAGPQARGGLAIFPRRTTTCSSILLPLLLAILTLALWAAPALAKQGGAVVRVSADPYSDPAGQHATEVEPDSFATKSTVVGAFQVGRTFAGGASNIGWATVQNGGKATENGFLPGITKVAGGPYDVASDPSVAYDAAHRVWLISSLALVVDPFPVGAAIVVSRSLDGIHWGDPVTVADGRPTGDLDKGWTTCDNHRSSPFFGHCYTEFDDFAQGDKIEMSTSTDGGKTWGAPQGLPAGDLGVYTQLGFGGQPVVQPDGTVIVPINNLVETEVRSFRSTDGGASWSTTVSVSPINRHIVAGGLRAPPFPSAEVDRNGNAYVVWADCRFRAGCTSNDLVLSKSADGLNWTSPTRIPIDPVDSGADHFIPGLAVDPHRSGDHARLALTYYSYPNAACTPATCELNVGFISSRDGGSTWSSPTELAGPMSLDWLPNTSQGRMVGDYISTSFVHNDAVPFFAEANPPTGGSFDEAIATVAGGLHVRQGRVASAVKKEPALTQHLKATAPPGPPAR